MRTLIPSGLSWYWRSSTKPECASAPAMVASPRCSACWPTLSIFAAVRRGDERPNQPQCFFFDTALTYVAVSLWNRQGEPSTAQTASVPQLRTLGTFCTGASTSPVACRCGREARHSAPAPQGFPHTASAGRARAHEVSALAVVKRRRASSSGTRAGGLGGGACKTPEPLFDLACPPHLPHVHFVQAGTDCLSQPRWQRWRGHANKRRQRMWALT